MPHPTALRRGIRARPAVGEACAADPWLCARPVEVEWWGGKFAAGLTHAVGQTIRALDRNLAVSDVQMLKDALSTSLRLERLAANTSSAIAITALLLASLGVYGLLACIVAERTREIGIRMAFGAATATVVRMVMARGLQLIACGSLLGLSGGLVVSELIRGF